MPLLYDIVDLASNKFLSLKGELVCVASKLVLSYYRLQSHTVPFLMLLVIS